MESKYYNTKTIEVGKYSSAKHYCLYCGKEVPEIMEIGSYHNNIDDEYYYHCDCENAQKEHQLALKKKEMERQIDLETREIQWELDKKIRDNEKNIKLIQYNYDLEQLNKNYGIK